MNDRPTEFPTDGTLRWTIFIRDTSGDLLDADSTPTVAVLKNGVAVGDPVTVTKREATTGIYDCQYNPTSEVVGDVFQIEEAVAVSSTTYNRNPWQAVVTPNLAQVQSLANNSITSSVVATNAFNNSAFTTGYFNEIASSISIDDLPTVAEFEARTLPAAEYSTLKTGPLSNDAY